MQFARRVGDCANRIRTMISSILISMIDRSNTVINDPTGGSSVLNPPDTLQSLNSRLLYFYSFCALLIGAVWFSICVSLYVIGVEYHVMNVMYESRWIPCTIVIAGATAAMLGVWKRETFYVGCGLSSVYSCAGCLVTAVVYCLDFRKAMYQLHPPITSRMAGYPRRKYLQLCGCMVIVSLLGVCLSILLLFKLWQLAGWYLKRVTLHRSQRSYLLFSAIAQLPLIWFSVYVTSHVISLPFSYVHQYMIQELLCALTLKGVILLQALHYIRGNRLTLKLLLFLNACQTIQEVFYTWNSYYISLYIHTSKAKLAVGADTDQYLMSANFLCHFARTCIAAYTTYHLSVWLKAPFMNAYYRLEMDRKVRQALVLLACLALLLAGCHVIMDVLYTVSSHIYRTLIAFTGISVFYLGLIGVCLALFVRSGHTLLLIIASVIMLLLSAVSIHALYIYMDTSFHISLLTHFDTMGRDKRKSSYMHFAESILALLSFVLCLIGGVVLFRILHIDSNHDRRDGRLRRPLMAVFVLGIVQLELASVNAALIVAVNGESKVFQSMLAYGVLDSISMFILCLTQIYIARPFNSHLNYGLTALLLFLTCESLTTYNYLSTKTTYIQLLIVFSQMFAGNLSVRQTLLSLFPADEVGLLLASHVVQLVQWVLTIVSLALTALSLELLYEQRKDIATSASNGPVTTIAATEASVSGAIVNTTSNNGSKSKGTMKNGDRTDTVNGATAVEYHRSYDNPVYDQCKEEEKNEDLETAEETTDKETVKMEQETPKREDPEKGVLLPQSEKKDDANEVEESKGKLIHDEKEQPDA